MQKCERYLVKVETAKVRTKSINKTNRQEERERERDASRGEEPRSRGGVGGNRLFKLYDRSVGSGPTSEASIASGERILEIQWPSSICMDDRYANHWNL